MRARHPGGGTYYPQLYSTLAGAQFAAAIACQQDWLRSSRSGTQGSINCTGDLLARARCDRVPERNSPALGSRARTRQAQIRNHGGLINMTSDLLRAALSGDMLSARQMHPARAPGKPDEILSDQRYCTPRAPLPRCVGHRIHDNLTHNPPTSVV